MFVVLVRAKCSVNLVSSEKRQLFACSQSLNGHCLTMMGRWIEGNATAPAGNAAFEKAVFFFGSVRLGIFSKRRCDCIASANRNR
jgi:hypothetical protein